MMTSVSGKRGIGKTYQLARVGYEKSKQGFFFISNFAHLYANIDCSKEDPEILYEIIRQIGVFKERGYELCDLDPRFTHSGIFIAIDEAHLYFSADLFKRYQEQAHFQYILKFLSQARKADVEIWYSSQDPAKIDKNWRRYTEDWIRYVPVIPIYVKKNILVQRPRRVDGTMPLPFFRREVRYPIPLVWEEHHKLDLDNPTFDYSMVQTPDGGYTLSPKATLQHRHIIRSGWMNPFPYRLYDSNQMLAMQGDPDSDDFGYIKKYGYIEHTFGYERFPTIKRLLGIKRKDQDLPVRRHRVGFELPAASSAAANKQVLSQPVEFLDDLKFFNKGKIWQVPDKERRNALRFLRKRAERAPKVLSGAFAQDAAPSGEMKSSAGAAGPAAPAGASDTVE